MILFSRNFLFQFVAKVKITTLTNYWLHCRERQMIPGPWSTLCHDSSEYPKVHYCLHKLRTRAILETSNKKKNATKFTIHLPVHFRYPVAGTKLILTRDSRVTGKIPSGQKGCNSSYGGALAQTGASLAHCRRVNKLD